MKGKIISKEDFLIRLEAENEDEADILRHYFDESGIRTISLGGRTLSISSPKTANVKAYFFNIEEENMIMRALLKYLSNVNVDKIKRIMEKFV